MNIYNIYFSYDILINLKKKYLIIVIHHLNTSFLCNIKVNNNQIHFVLTYCILTIH